MVVGLLLAVHLLVTNCGLVTFVELQALVLQLVEVQELQFVLEVHLLEVQF